MSIRFKLALVFLVVIALLSAALTFSAAQRTLDASGREITHDIRIESNLVEREYTNLLKSVSTDVRYLADSVNVGSNTRMTKYYNGIAEHPADNDLLEERRIKRDLTTYIEHKKQFDDIYIGMHDGGFTGVSEEGILGFEPRKRPWYEAAIAHPGEIAVTEPYIGTSGQTMISVATTLSSGPRILGVISVDVTLGELTELVSSLNIGGSGYFLLLDRHGTILADPAHPENLSRKLNEAYVGISRAAPSALRKGVGMTIRSFGNIGWRIAAIVDYDDYRAQATAQIRELLLTSALLAGLFIIVGIFLAGRTVAVIRQMSAKLERINSGDTEALDKLAVASNDEIGELVAQFNSFLIAERDKRDELLRMQKLEAIGQLAAGVAHEINTPTQYVSDNVKFLEESMVDLKPLLATQSELLLSLREAGANDDTIDSFAKVLEDADVEFLIDEIPGALEQSRYGLSQIARIVRAMKDFSHPGDECQQTDINHGLETTLTVARNEWKYVAEIDTQFAESLQSIECIPSTMNQVFLNIIVNAAHAIGERKESEPDHEGRITIVTANEEDGIRISISDNGCGIPEDVCAKIFDPFFTTKEVGKGTGQGLSIAHNVVVEQHGGTLVVDSKPGVGTTFNIRLPLEFAAKETDQEAA